MNVDPGELLSLVETLSRSTCELTELRIEEITGERLSTTSAKVNPIEKSLSVGCSVRVLKGGAWGFAASAIFSEQEIERIFNIAIDIADASRMINSSPVLLSPLENSSAGIDHFETPVVIDPFSIALNEKIDRLLHWEELATRNERITSSSTFIDLRRCRKHLVTSAGIRVSQTIDQIGAGITCGVVKGRRERYERSFPTASGQFVTGGYEKLDEFDIESNIERIAEEAVALESAAECPSKITDIVLSPDLASLQIHESIGHPLELDRVFGSERNFSGVSFATPDKLGKLKYASDIVNVYSDPTFSGGLSTYGFDDEGVRAKRVPLIESGVLVGYLSSRETAARLELSSSAAARADGWGNIPLVRMTNLILEPADQRFSDMIAEIDDGIFISGVSTWSIDDNRENFTLGGEIGWEIKGGKLGAMVKSPTYSGNTVQFWNSCDSVGHPEEWVLWGTPNCGKGEPGQNARTAQGSAYLRFRRVKVGV